VERGGLRQGADGRPLQRTGATGAVGAPAAHRCVYSRSVLRKRSRSGRGHSPGSPSTACCCVPTASWHWPNPSSVAAETSRTFGPVLSDYFRARSPACTTRGTELTPSVTGRARHDRSERSRRERAHLPGFERKCALSRRHRGSGGSRSPGLRIARDDAYFGSAGVAVQRHCDRAHRDRFAALPEDRLHPSSSPASRLRRWPSSPRSAPGSPGFTLSSSRSEEPGGRPRERGLHARPTLAPRVTRSSSSCWNVSTSASAAPVPAASRASFEG
jgi:hypothetical protein